MGFIVSVTVGFASGILSSMGFGGGTVLLLYFALFTSIAQVQAQGINLVYFLPVAALSLVFHIKNKAVKFKILPPIIIFGVIGAVAGAYLSTKILDDNILRKLFALCILCLGIYELFTKNKENGGKSNEKSKQIRDRRQG